MTDADRLGRDPAIRWIVGGKAIEQGYGMTKRRKFTSGFRAKVALKALRGDQTIQEIASRHKVHANQVSTWKRQAMDGLGSVFSNGEDQALRKHEAEVHDLHAKIGQLTVERGFLARGLKR